MAPSAASSATRGPAKSTAFVHRIHRHGEFVGRHRRVYSTRVVKRRARDDGMGMVPDFRRPELIARHRVGGYHPAVVGAEDEPRIARGFRRESRRFERQLLNCPLPPHAARIALQGKKTARRGADEHGVFRHQRGRSAATCRHPARTPTRVRASGHCCGRCRYPAGSASCVRRTPSRIARNPRRRASRRNRPPPPKS